MGARIEGVAYGRRATLEVAADTLTWRAQPGAPENIVTTVHDVSLARCVELRISRAGLALIALGVIFWFQQGAAVGGAVLGVALVLSIYTFVRPRVYLVLEMRDRRLVLKLDRASLPGARALAERIQRALASGEVPDSPPALP